MLFNSVELIFVFMPIVFFGFYLIGRFSPIAAASWLAASSLVFYGWWSLTYVALLLASISANYIVAICIDACHRNQSPQRARAVLIFAVTGNLMALGYYKYANFFIANLSAAFPDLAIANIVLPIGISFFTFTQIAYLVDTYVHKVAERNPVHYALFVTYFPHLIAGPILHHSEMMPQFRRVDTYKLNLVSVAAGSALFTFGLFKKVVFADSIAPYVGPTFASPAPTLVEAWSAALSYTMQLYFDFSGYTDMALGLSLFFGIRLPLNFASPYRSANIIEFWRRWHMTLSRFLRSYLYIPLGGNRRGHARRYLNLLTTMLLGGLWHGAGWTFVIWGGLHGVYLVVNHAWHGLRVRLGLDAIRSNILTRGAGRLITFVCVVVAWVFFRAADVPSALRVLAGMAGANGIPPAAGWSAILGPLDQWLGIAGAARDPNVVGSNLPLLAVLLAIAWWAPNTQEILARFSPALEAVKPSYIIQWRPSWGWALLLGALAAIAVTTMSENSEFLYFQF